MPVTRHEDTAPASRPALPEWAATYDEGRLLQQKPFPSLCYAPFTTLDFGPTGDVIVCCANTTHVVGNVRTHTISEIWNGPAIQAIRTALRTYEFARGCDKCIWQVAHGDLRTTYSKRDDVYALDGTWPLGPLKMDFRLANTCNLACVMCSGLLSSTIRRDVDHLPPLDCDYPDAFFEELEGYIPHLRYAWFTGGEPFLIHNNYQIWDRIIAHGNRVACRITTNATIVNDKVRDYLERLQLTDLCVSIDGATKETFEKIRRGASFDQVRDHLAYFGEYCRRTGANFRFAVCGLAMNWRELPEIYLMARACGASVWANVVQPSPARTPDQAVSMLEMSGQDQREAAGYLARRFEEIEEALDDESKANYQLMLNSIGGPVVFSGVRTGTEQSIW